MNCPVCEGMQYWLEREVKSNVHDAVFCNRLHETAAREKHMYAARELKRQLGHYYRMKGATNNATRYNEKAI